MRKDGRTGRHDEASSRFWAILRTRLKTILNIYSEDRENSSYAVRAVTATVRSLSTERLNKQKTC